MHAGMGQVRVDEIKKIDKNFGTVAIKVLKRLAMSLKYHERQITKTQAFGVPIFDALSPSSKIQ